MRIFFTRLDKPAGSGQRKRRRIMARLAGFEHVTFAFAGKSSSLRRDSLECDIIRQGTDLVIKIWAP
jgi:hypothetical protein